MKQLAVFVSGSGTNAENLIRHFSDSEKGRVAVVISNRPDALALDKARALGVPVEVVPRAELTPERLLPMLESYGIDFIVLAGFLPRIPDFLIDAYEGRMVNLHPSLLPEFGGKGMYGHHVHEAVKAAGKTETGMTVHYVSREIDGGRIIAQFRTPIEASDSVDEIAEKEHRLEMKHFPGVIASLLGLLLLLFLPACRNSRAPETPVEPAGPDPRAELLGFSPDSLDCRNITLAGGETFGGLLARLGVPAAESQALTQTASEVLDFRTLRAGNAWHAWYDTTAVHRLRYLVYEKNRSTLAIVDCRPPYAARLAEKPVLRELRAMDCCIETSLWVDMKKAGASANLIGSLSEIFAWTVDFFGLQKGDRFRALYLQSRCDGEVIGIDSVYYAVFSRGGKEIPAILLDQGDHGNLHWDAQGNSLRKAFLKAPLKFSRISSGFSYHRKHPVTGQVKAHTAVDYAAPTGTPVMSIGDGTVISKGWGGGGGNTVKIRHNSVYTTAYLHLSRYASGIQAGARVRQGQVIGYVGATGTATGPHLDFRVWKNGTPVNPLKMESPPSEPIRAALRPRLDSLRQCYAVRLDSLLAVQAPACAREGTDEPDPESSSH